VINKSALPISRIPKIVYVNMALDGGHLLLTDDEKEIMLNERM
jgi:hypothetical protein